MIPSISNLHLEIPGVGFRVSSTLSSHTLGLEPVVTGKKLRGILL